jgi:hypothetical protein
VPDSLIPGLCAQKHHRIKAKNQVVFLLHSWTVHMSQVKNTSRRVASHPRCKCGWKNTGFQVGFATQRKRIERETEGGERLSSRVANAGAGGGPGNGRALTRRRQQQPDGVTEQTLLMLRCRARFLGLSQASCWCVAGKCAGWLRSFRRRR